MQEKNKTLISEGVVVLCAMAAHMILNIFCCVRVLQLHLHRELTPRRAAVAIIIIGDSMVRRDRMICPALHRYGYTLICASTLDFGISDLCLSGKHTISPPHECPRLLQLSVQLFSKEALL